MDMVYLPLLVNVQVHRSKVKETTPESNVYLIFTTRDR